MLIQPSEPAGMKGSENRAPESIRSQGSSGGLEVNVCGAEHGAAIKNAMEAETHTKQREGCVRPGCQMSILFFGGGVICTGLVCGPNMENMMPVFLQFLINLRLNQPPPPPRLVIRSDITPTLLPGCHWLRQLPISFTIAFSVEHVV